MTTYSEKLKDPRWQKKRLEILERDNWECQSCSNKEDTLHVHHHEYHDNPWDTPSDELETLCDDCHENLHVTIRQIEEERKEYLDIINGLLQRFHPGKLWVIERCCYLMEGSNHKWFYSLIHNLSNQDVKDDVV